LNQQPKGTDFKSVVSTDFTKQAFIKRQTEQKGSNLRPIAPKATTLPLRHTPFLLGLVGIEPTHSGLKDQHSTNLSYKPTFLYLKN
jgi:hypothetical protein